ncbi:uncharacterized protein LOC120340372 isoform X1 [Styela clava]
MPPKWHLMMESVLLNVRNAISGEEISDVDHPKFRSKSVQTTTTGLTTRKVSPPPKQFRPQRDGRPRNSDSSEDKEEAETTGQNDVNEDTWKISVGAVGGSSVIISASITLIIVAIRRGCCTCNNCCNYCC